MGLLSWEAWQTARVRMVDEIFRLPGQSQERLLRCSVPRLLDHRFAALAKALDLFQNLGKPKHERVSKIAGTCTYLVIALT